MAEASTAMEDSTAFDDRFLLSELWPFLRPHRRLLFVAMITAGLSAALSLTRPIIMLVAIDESIAAKDSAVIFRGGLIYAGVTIAEQLLTFAQVYATQVVGARSMADLRAAVFRFLGQLPMRFFDRQPVGRLVTRVTNDVDSILELFNAGAVSAVADVFKLGGVVVLMLLLDVRLSLVAFASLPLIALLVAWVRRRARQVFREIRGETARMNANMNEQVTGGALIRAYGREALMFGEFDAINASYRDANIRSIKYDAIQDAAIDAVSAISLASIIVALGYHHASLGTVVALTIYLVMFFEPISMLAQRFTLLQSALSGAERVFGLLRVAERDAALCDSAGSAGSSDSAGSAGSSRYALELSHVSFAYKPGHDVLRDVSLRAKVGETIALVGPTGSGKTTITALLLRLYEHDRGVVRVFGDDVTSLERDTLRRRFAVVPQDVFLFAGSLAENIAVGEDVDRERAHKVLEQMGVLDVFLAREGGLSAPVSPGGANYSAGERQLIAFARALYRDAKILILDEATASVDSDTEARMQRALEVLLRGRTAIVVAHRLSTIRAADRIVVLQKGRVVERGGHEELMRADGLYAALHRLQFSRE